MPASQALLTYLSRLEEQLLAGSKAPGWDEGVNAAIHAARQQVGAGGEDVSVQAMEGAISSAEPCSAHPATRAGFLAAEGRILGFLDGGAAAVQALIPLSRENGK